jgi:hypothetical protein
MSIKQRKLKTRVIRISEEAYQTMKILKSRHEKQEGQRLTYSDFLIELNNVAAVLVEGNETYEVDNRLYADRAEAWGAAVQLLVKGNAVRPTVYLKLGHDDAFSLPEPETL